MDTEELLRHIRHCLDKMEAYEKNSQSATITQGTHATLMSTYHILTYWQQVNRMAVQVEIHSRMMTEEIRAKNSLLPTL